MSSNLLEEAVGFAFEAHRGQYRSNRRTPYIVHPMGVMRMVARHFAHPDILSAAVLHDVVEDTEIGIDTIEREFGSRVASIVRELTVPPYAPDKKAWQLEHLSTMSPEAIFVKLCDRTDNILDLADSTFSAVKTLDYILHTEEMLLRTPVVRGTMFDDAIRSAKKTLQLALVSAEWPDPPQVGS